MTGVDHETIGEFHGFGTGGTKFSGDDDFTTLCARLHDKSQDTIASTIVSNEESPRVKTYRRTANPAKSLYLKLSH